jgi:adenylate cyclase
LNRVRRHIAFKLVVIIAVVLILSLAAITVMVSILIGADVRVSAEDNNLSVNEHLASAINLLPSLDFSARGGGLADALAILEAGQNPSFITGPDGTALLETGAIADASIFTPFAKTAVSGDDESGQRLWTALDGNAWFVAFHKLKNAKAAVLTVISRDEVFAGVNAATKRNILASCAALAFSILLVLLYSRTISKPLAELILASQKIEEGDYDIELVPKSHDEIGALTKSFVNMGHGLTNFERFTNKMIVEKARKGILTLSGEMKTVTVCFAFIRDFHAIAAKMNPAQVVSFTNDFLAVMAPCVTDNGGSIDKFLTQDGMVIMALWGAVESSGSERRDALNCIKALLDMRKALKSYNERGGTSQNALNSNFISKNIKLGCGVNTGEVVVGQMGSYKRMEFTVIGDAVNLAARFEGPNDLFDTDILISENTYTLLKNDIIVEEKPSLAIKGKEEVLRVFAVIGLAGRNVGEGAAA